MPCLCKTRPHPHSRTEKVIEIGRRSIIKKMKNNMGSRVHNSPLFNVRMPEQTFDTFKRNWLITTITAHSRACAFAPTTSCRRGGGAAAAFCFISVSSGCAPLHKHQLNKRLPGVPAFNVCAYAGVSASQRTRS